MLHKDNQVAMGSLLPEGQMNNMMQGQSQGFGQPPPATENPWIAAAAASTAVPLMPPNPPGPFGPAPVPPVSGSVPVGGDLDLRQMDPRMRNQGGGNNQDFDL